MSIDLSMRAYIEGFGSSICGNLVRNMTYLEHAHMEYEILYVLEGELEACILGHRFTAGPKAFFFIANGVPHSYATPKDSLSLVAACAPEEVPQFARLLEQSGVSACYLSGSQQTPSLYSAVQALKECFVLDESRVTLSGYLNLVFSHVADALQANPPLPPRRLTTVERALPYIADALPGNITAEEAARSAGVTKYHFARLFSQSIGVNFSTYVALMKTNVARRMLVQTELPIREICVRCGYSNPRSFDRDFIRFSGVSPREYRSREAATHITNYDAPLVQDILLKRWRTMPAPQLIGETLGEAPA